MSASAAATSEDAVLGGRLVLRQPLRGHRVGHDAILLAAATSAAAGEHAVDLGSGVGGAGLALARRVEAVRVTLLEIDPELTALAAANAERNGLADRVRAVCLDVDASDARFADAGLTAGSADQVLMNPPFNVSHHPSPDPGRRGAHEAAPDTLRRWLGVAARLLRPGGAVTLIWRADALAGVLAALTDDFGAVAILPIRPKPGATAIRIVARAIKGSRGGIVRLPGLDLAGADNKPTAQAEAILRQNSAIAMTGN